MKGLLFLKSYFVQMILVIESISLLSYPAHPRLLHTLSGLDQSGITPTIADSIALLPEHLQGMFWAHIGLIGGNTKFQGFRERL